MLKGPMLGSLRIAFCNRCVVLAALQFVQDSQTSCVVLRHFESVGTFRDCKLTKLCYDEEWSGKDSEEAGTDTIVFEGYYDIGFFPSAVMTPGSKDGIYWWLERKDADSEWEVVDGGCI